MNRSLPVILLCLLLLTAVACSQSAATNAPQGTERAQEAQNSPMVSELASPTNQKPPTPDYPAQTQAALMAQSAAATQKIQVALWQISTETKAASITQVLYNAQTLTAQPRAQTATKSAQSTADMLASARMTQEADSATQTKDAPADMATAAKLGAQAKNAPLLTVAEPITKIFGSLALFLIVLLGGWLAVRPHAQSTADEPEEEPAQWVQTGPSTIARRNSSADTVTLDISNGAKKAYFEHALGNHSLGINAVKRSLPDVDAEELEIATEYMDAHGYITTEKLDRGGRRNVLSDTGKHYAEGELMKLHNSPAPDVTIAESTPSTRYERAETSVSPAGEVVDPGYGDNFSAERTNYKPIGYVLPEDKKEGE